MSVRRAFEFRLAALALATVASIGVAEAALRLSGCWIGRHSDTMFAVLTHDPLLGWRMKPKLALSVDFVDVEGIPVRSNSQGFWGDELGPAVSADRCRIAFLGDSFTWGMGVREAERFSNRVMAARPRWESLNFGIPGYGTDQSLLVWEHIAAPLQPRVAVLTVYQNDGNDNLHAIRYGRAKPYFVRGTAGGLELRNVPVSESDFWGTGLFNQVAPPYAALFTDPTERRSPLLHWMLKNSDAARLVYTVARMRPGPAVASVQEGRAEERAPGPVSRAGTADTRRTVEAALLLAEVRWLERQVAATGAALLVVLAGDRIGPLGDFADRFCRDGQGCVDATTSVLAPLVPAGAAPVYYPYSRHWTAAAHAVVGKLLVDAIDREGLCDAAPASTGQGGA